MAEETKHIQFSKSGVDQIQLKIPAMAEKEEISVCKVVSLLTV